MMHAPPWITRLSDHLYFGPRPKTPEDMVYITEELGLHHIVNASTNAAVNKHTGELERSAYECDFAERFHFSVTHCALPEAALTTGLKGALTLLATIRALAREISPPQTSSTKGGKSSRAPAPPLRRIYVHAESGLQEEAYIGLLLWRLTAPKKETPADVLAWLRTNNKQGLFDDDDDKRALLAECWRLLDGEQERLDKMSVFGLVVKRPPKKPKVVKEPL